MKTFRITYKDSSVQIVTGDSVRLINEPVKWGLVRCIEEIEDYEMHSTPLINSTFKLIKMKSGKLYLQSKYALPTDDVSGCKLMNAVDNHITHLEGHVDGLNRQVTALEQQVSELLSNQPKSGRLMQLRELCGYIENGTDTKVVVFQDDATSTWYVSVGFGVENAKVYAGETLPLAIQEAYSKHTLQQM